LSAVSEVDIGLFLWRELSGNSSKRLSDDDEMGLLFVLEMLNLPEVVVFPDSVLSGVEVFWEALRVTFLVGTTSFVDCEPNSSNTSD